ncbi:hypothetical protein HYT55_00420 [Candidatus Woesearchaeota archaeon]|nr:hypothetical protein [Candidatus Woesearchaeota archaeon]
MNRRWLLALLSTCVLQGDRQTTSQFRNIFSEHTFQEIAASLTLPLRHTPTLVVNTDNTYHLTALKSEKEGVKDLQKLAQRADREEVYVFLPEEERWIEIGYKESAIELQVTPQGEVYGKVTAACDPLLDIFLAQHKSLAIYHFHPRLFREKTIALLKEHPPKKETLEDAIAFQQDNHVLPSSIDLFSMITESAKYYHQYHPDGEIVFNVVSAEGVTRYEIDSNLRKDFSQGDSQEVISFAQTLGAVHVHVDRKEFWKQNGRNLTSYIQSLNFLGVRMRYQSFSDRDDAGQTN